MCNVREGRRQNMKRYIFYTYFHYRVMWSSSTTACWELRLRRTDMVSGYGEQMQVKTFPDP
jgi:hypothetical protein